MYMYMYMQLSNNLFSWIRFRVYTPVNIKCRAYDTQIVWSMCKRYVDNKRKWFCEQTSSCAHTLYMMYIVNNAVSTT